ncbi:MAG: aspH [Myxococcaceae bacterium]|nr:aspH [Myxococcaceae bacterium]
MKAPEAESTPERPGILGMIGLIFAFSFIWVMTTIIKLTPNAKKRFFKTEDFPWVAEMEAGWEDIRDELAPFLERKGAMDVVPNLQQVEEEEARLTQDDLWKVMILVGFGVRNEPTLARFPKTAALLDKVPGMTTAMFSILRDKKHIPPHKGPFKLLLRYHLALEVPIDPDIPDACRIRVGDEMDTWTPGKSLVFDDTNVHEVWKDTPIGVRAILFLDFVRPLPWPLSVLNNWAVRCITYLPFIVKLNDRLKGWEVDHGAELDALARSARRTKKSKPKAGVTA